MSGRRIARAFAAGLLAAAVAAPVAPAGAADPVWMAPVRDRYESGDVATVVGYVGRGSLGWVDDGPFYAYLHDAASAPSRPSERGEPLGPLTVEETGATGWTALRVSVEVPLTGLAPGRYRLGYCNDPCTAGLGDLAGSRVISVGVEPLESLVRDWPLDEPLIRILAADAMVGGPGYLAPAAEIRAGRVVPALPVVPVAPEPVPTAVPPAAPPSVPTTLATAPPAATTVSIVYVPMPVPAAAAEPVPGDDGSPLLVIIGILLVAACTGGVLRAMRSDGTAVLAAAAAARPA